MDEFGVSSMIKLRIRTVQKAESRSNVSVRREATTASYTSAASRSNPHYDRWPSLPPHLPRASH